MTGVPMTNLYRSRDKGFKTGEEIVKDATSRLINHNGKMATLKDIASSMGVDPRKLKRRMDAGAVAGGEIKAVQDARGRTPKTATLTPSEVIDIYFMLFTKQKTQKLIAKEMGVHQTTISDIWRGKRWGWITSPIRFELEGQVK